VFRNGAIGLLPDGTESGTLSGMAAMRSEDTDGTVIDLRSHEVSGLIGDRGIRQPLAVERGGMTHSTVVHTAVTPPTDLGEAARAQIQEVREQLQFDAAAAGVNRETVDAAVDTAVAAYAGARVHAFIGILVERDVRDQLRLRSTYLRAGSLPT
jgi:hypothetical protein